MFFDNYVHICEHFGKAPTMVLRNIGISASAYQNWKAGGNPTNSTKRKLADYFGITIAELVSGEIKKPVTDDDELNEYLDQLRNRSEMRMLFKLAKGATKEEVEQAVKIIEALRK